MSFGPKNESEKKVFAIEGFRVGVQHQIQRLLNEKKVSRKELAQRLEISEPRVSQLFADNANPTVVTLAKVFFALGDECYLSSHILDALDRELERGAVVHDGVVDLSAYKAKLKKGPTIEMDTDEEDPCPQCETREVFAG